MKSKKSRRPRKETINDIPEVKQALRTKWRLLGRVTADCAEEPITRGQCMSAVAVACTSTLLARIFMSVRVLRVRIWQIDSNATDPLGSVSATGNPSVSWASNYGPLVKTLKPQMGTEPGHCDTKPPKDSQASFWSESNSDENDVLFYFNALSGSIIQVEMDCWVNDSSVAPTTGSTSGKVVGSLYYNLGSKISFLNMN